MMYWYKNNLDNIQLILYGSPQAWQSLTLILPAASVLHQLALTWAHNQIRILIRIESYACLDALRVESMTSMIR